MSEGKAQGPLGEKVPSLLESFLACKPLIFRVLRKMVRPEDIEDIVQDVFVNSYAASRKQIINNPQAFMLQTARNIALSRLKEVSGKRKAEIEEFIDEKFTAYAKTIEEQYESEERFLFFCRAVARLSPSCRRVFILIKVYGLTNREVAEFLNLHSSTIEKHVARGMVDVISYMNLKEQAESRISRDRSSRARVTSGE